MTRNKTPLRVGFDLDGVILYHPARVVRTLVKQFKHRFIPKRENTFYIPKSHPEKIMWRVFHWSSIFIASGFDEIKELSKQKKIEPYIITARFDFMEPDFNYWLNRMKVNSSFKASHLNKKNQQPHLYKEEMVKKLKLDIFVEDNWDIVQHLSKKTKAKIFWVYNLFDYNIPYPYRFPSLSQVLQKIHEEIRS